MKIPFVGGAYKARSTNLNAQECINLFPVIDKQDAKEVTALYGTPGLASFSTLEVESATSTCRGIHVFAGSLYAVIGANVYRVNSAGGSQDIGSIGTTSGPVFMDDNGREILLVDGTDTGYLVDTSGNIDEVTDNDFPMSGSVTFQDGYFIVTHVNTGEIWISGLYDGNSWDALDFATAEGKPDNSLRTISNNRDLWIFGTKSTEVFYNSGDSDFPFQRISGAVLDVGLASAAAAVKVKGVLFWLTDLGQIVQSNGYGYTPISTEHIDYAISGYTISDATMYTYNLEGNDFVVTNFPTDGKTWVYCINTGWWHEWRSYAAGDDSVSWSRHRGQFGAMFDRKPIIGDFQNGKLYELNMNTYTDNGYAIQRIRATQTISSGRSLFVTSWLEIEFESGVGLDEGAQGEDPQACLEWSDDGGHTWSNEHWTGFGKQGEYRRRAIWKRLGKSRGRIYRLTITDPVKVVILGADADMEAMSA